jgi:hypothetical protein
MKCNRLTSKKNRIRKPSEYFNYFFFLFRKWIPLEPEFFLDVHTFAEIILSCNILQLSIIICQLLIFLALLRFLYFQILREGGYFE